MSSSTQYTSSTRTVYFPIDIGKNVHWFAAYAGAQLQPLMPPEKVRANRAGFDRVASVLAELLTDDRWDLVVTGHEPTGVYHESWAFAIQRRFADNLAPSAHPHLEHCLVNPYQVKQARNRIQGRNRKTDPIDLPPIARCLADGSGNPVHLPTPDDLTFQQWAAALRRTSGDLRVLAHRALSDLDRLWPGALVDVARFRRAHPELEPPQPLVRTCPLERKLIIALIEQGPDPYRFRRMDQPDLIAWLRTHVGRGGPVTAQRILACANDALLPPANITAVLANNLQAGFATYRATQSRLDALKCQCDSLIADSPAQILVTVPGISPYLAARYYAGIRHPRRFRSAGQVWAFAGFDPLPSDSGDSRHTGPISKKGDPFFRDTLYLIGMQTSTHCPPSAHAKHRARQRGVGAIGSVLHAAHKANRLCWHLLTHQQAYCPDLHR
jgi:transposase